MNHASNCNCRCERKVVQVKLKLHGFKWEESLSYDPADAAQHYVELLFNRGEINIASGNIIALETEQNGVRKHFTVERRDITMFDAKEI